jgi:hypothetical protein
MRPSHTFMAVLTAYAGAATAADHNNQSSIDFCRSIHFERGEDLYLINHDLTRATDFIDLGALATKSTTDSASDFVYSEKTMFIVAKKGLDDGGMSGSLSFAVATDKIATCKSANVFSLRLGVAPIKYGPGRFKFDFTPTLTNRNGQPIGTTSPIQLTGDIRTSWLSFLTPGGITSSLAGSIVCKEYNAIAITLVNSGNEQAVLEGFNPEFDINGAAMKNNNCAAGTTLLEKQSCKMEIVINDRAKPTDIFAWYSKIRASINGAEIVVRKKEAEYVLEISNK